MSILPVTLVQMAFLVPNLEEGCAALNRAYGWGPFLGGTEGVLADHAYRGQSADPIRIRGVFVQTGTMTEIHPDLPIIRAMYGETRAAAKTRPGNPAIAPFAASL